MTTVVIDAGHGGLDPGAVYDGRLEKDDNLRLALATGAILAENGINVVYTRTDDVYDTPFQKALIANNNNADYLISFHRNASEKPASASGSEVLVYSKDSKAADLAENIDKALKEAGFTNRGVIERPGLAILRRSKMPAVLIETGFIDNPDDNKIFDDNFKLIAQSIADAVLKTIQSDDKLHSSEYAYDNEDRPLPPPVPKLYRVQVGAFRNSNNAYELNDQLSREGFPAFILMDDGLYKVQAGAYTRLENAIRMEYRLRAAGYDTYITTK